MSAPMRFAAKPLAWLLLISALLLPYSATPRPALEPQQEELCEAEGGCVYASRARIEALLVKIREQAKAEAQALCGARAGLTL